MPPAAELQREIAIARGGFLASAADRWTHEESPLLILALLGFKTLSAMLIGMAGYRSGFLTGRWDRARYRRWALVCLGIAGPLYAALAVNTLAHGFFPPWVFFASILAAEPLRPIMAIGYAALVMTFVFDGWGLGQFGAWSRAQLYLLAPLAWAVMLAWSKPWLDRLRYGPMEWVWRTVARFELQPMKGAANATG